MRTSRWEQQAPGQELAESWQEPRSACSSSMMLLEELWRRSMTEPLHCLAWTTLWNWSLPVALLMLRVEYPYQLIVKVPWLNFRRPALPDLLARGLQAYFVRDWKSESRCRAEECHRFELERCLQLRKHLLFSFGVGLMV